VGVGLSAACALHCLAVPVLAGASFLSPSWLHAPAAEASIVGSAALIGYITLGMSFRHHRRALPLALLTTGLLLMVLGHVVPLPVGETATAVAGAALLIAGQLVDRRLRPCLDACCPAHD